MTDPTACPRCSTVAPLEIIYGLPDFELFEQAERGAVALGGCLIIDGETPAWRCRKSACAHEWGDSGDLERISLTE